MNAGEMSMPSYEADQGLELLLQKVQETDLENLRLKGKLQRFAALELTLKNLASTDMVARELLKMVEVA